MPYFDRFDICEAYYIYAMEYHGGQWSDLYSVMGRILNLGFRLSRLIKCRNDLTDNGKEIYDNLVSSKHLQ